MAGVRVRFSSFAGKDDKKEVLSVSFNFQIHPNVKYFHNVQTDGPLKLKQNLKQKLFAQIHHLLVTKDIISKKGSI